MKILYLAREYPPLVYGGAGVHLEHLAREMARHAEVRVFCFGNQEEQGNPEVRGFPYGGGIFAANPEPSAPALDALETCLRFNALPLEADLVHCHTWYSHAAGLIAKLAYGLPLVITAHSLEPMRPWKEEALGRGYAISSWVERAAMAMADGVIAVSTHDRRLIVSLFGVPPARVRVIPNGIDTNVYRKVASRAALEEFRIGDAPYALFLGRLSRQKGVGHFLRAAREFAPMLDVVLCAGAPDSPAIEAEVEEAVKGLRALGRRVILIRKHISREGAIELFSHAAVFCCPSIYEPFGLINLEAMACETPVVASAVGGIPDVVIPGETGFLIDCEAQETGYCQPRDQEAFARAFAHAVNRLALDPVLAREMGRLGRERAVREFSWERVAARTHEFYREVLANGRAE